MTNIIATFYISEKINLEELFQKCSEYCILNDIDPYLIMPTDFGILYIFASGKITSCGAKSIKDSKKTAEIFLEIIQEASLPKVRLFGYRIQNMRGTCTIQSEVQNRKDYLR